MRGIRSFPTPNGFTRRTDFSREGMYSLKRQKSFLVRFAKVLANQRSINILLVTLNNGIGTRIKLDQIRRTHDIDSKPNYSPKVGLCAGASTGDYEWRVEERGGLVRERR